MSKLVIVLSRNYSTALGVIRGLGMAGYEVDLILTLRSKEHSQAVIATSSRYIRNSYVINGSKYSETLDNDILDRLKSYIGTSEEKIMLFPVDDYSAMLMDRHREELKGQFVMPYIADGAPEAMTGLMDKSLQGALAKQAGLKTVREWVLDLGTCEIPEDMVYPCFVKPLQSMNGAKTELKRCRNEAELSAHLANLASRNADRGILVQEFLPIKEEISMSGVCIDQDIILPAMIHKTRVAKHEVGVTLSGYLIPVDSVGEKNAEAVYRFLRLLRYVGMFDMELLYSGGEYYFGEVNLRSGGPNFAYTLNGTNLPAIAARAVFGEDKDPSLENPVTYEKPFIYEKVAWEDYHNFYMSKKALTKALAECEDKLLTWAEDPEPGQHFDEIMKQSEKKERLKGLIKKTPAYKFYFRGNVKKQNPVDQTRATENGSTTADRKRVILLSRNFSSLLGLIRALAKRDYEIEVIHLHQKKPKIFNIAARIYIEKYSKYISNFHVFCVNHDSQSLVDELMRLYRPEQETLLIPADDLPAMILDECYDQLKDYYVLPGAGGKAGGCLFLMDKSNQKKMAVEMGLDCVQSHEIRIENHQYEVPEGISYPCFLKPAVSATSSKTIMRRCDSEEELRKTLDTQAAGVDKLPVIVEDFLEIEREYALLGLCAGDQVLIPNGIVQMLESGHAGRHGVTMIGQVVDTACMQETIDKIREFLKTLNFTGLFDIDLFEANGRIYFGEINLRFGASGYAITASGVNLPGIFADYMLKAKPIDTNAKLVKTGLTFVSEKVLLGDYGDHFISKAKVNEAMREADIHLVYNKKDPEPYRHFKKLYIVAPLMPVYNSLKNLKATLKRLKATLKRLKNAVR